MVVPFNDISHLKTDNHDVQITKLVNLKHTIIGHEEEKLTLLENGSYKTILEILRDTTDEEVKLQASIIVTSFTYGDDKIMKLLITLQTVEVILSTIVPSADSRLLMQSFRSLCCILSSRPDIIIHFGSQFTNTVRKIVSNPKSSESLLACACELIPLISPNPQLVKDLEELIKPLIEISYSRIQKYIPNSFNNITSLKMALYALTHLINDQYCSWFVSSFNKQDQLDEKTQNQLPIFEKIDPIIFIVHLLSLLRSNSDDLRLGSVILLCKLIGSIKSESMKLQMSKGLLPTLVMLIKSDNPEAVDPHVYQSLATLCKDNQEDAFLVGEGGVIKKVAESILLLNYNNPKGAQLVADGLLVEACICIHDDEHRLAVVENGILKYIVEIITKVGKTDLSELTPSTASSLRKVTIASCYVLRALSRSVNLLRTSLENDDIVEGIVGLLSMNYKTENGIHSEGGHFEVDETLDVKTAIMAAVCNIVLEFGTLVKKLIEKGIIPLIVEGVNSTYSPLRLNSIWALRHLVYMAQPELKNQVMEHLTYDSLMALCNDNELQVQEQSLCFIRNLICTNVTQIGNLFDNIGKDRFFDILESKIKGAIENGMESQVIVSVIYILANIASCSEHYQDIIINQGSILKKIAACAENGDWETKTACGWLVINLTWNEQETRENLTDSCRHRANELIGHGFKRLLIRINQDPVIDIRRQASTALFQLNSLTGAGTD